MDAKIPIRPQPRAKIKVSGSHKVSEVAKAMDVVINDTSKTAAEEVVKVDNARVVTKVREAAAAKRCLLLNSPAIVRVVGMCSTCKYYFLAIFCDKLDDAIGLAISLLARIYRLISTRCLDYDGSGRLLSGL
jgi:hypothetical protein